MAGRSKFVSIALAITLFTSQMAALSACWIPMPAMQEMAMGDAGMTANMRRQYSAGTRERLLLRAVGS